MPILSSKILPVQLVLIDLPVQAFIFVSVNAVYGFENEVGRKFQAKIIFLIIKVSFLFMQQIRTYRAIRRGDCSVV